MKYPLQDLTRIANTDWARLAAFIDGEGCIHSALTVHKPSVKWKNSRTHYEYIKITVTNTDPRLSQWIVNTFGGGNIQHHTNNKRKNTNWKSCFFWSVSSEKAAAILRGVMPYLLLKKDQAEIALVIQSTMCRSGRRGTPQHVIDHRTELRNKLHVLNARGTRRTATGS